MLKGVWHVHSVFSDGEESLERLAEIFRQSGLDYMAVSDHAEVFDAARMAEYVERCASLSRESFTVIPGLEFASHGGLIHILGYGITERVRARDLEGLVDGIHGAGGVAVLAHPPAGSTNLIATIKSKLDGVEVWNGRYDGPHTPRAQSFQLLRRVREVNGGARAYGGVDLHTRGQAQKPITVEVDAGGREWRTIVAAMAAGRFSVRGGSLVIPSDGGLTFIQELAIAVKQPLCRARAG